MKIKTIKITPNGDEFELRISPESGDNYVDETRTPSANGVYHFDCSKYSDNEASLMLVNCMIARHEE